MAWIDYKKVADMVPHLWSKECLELFEVAENIKTLLVNSMEKWRVMLCAGNSELGEVERYFSRRVFIPFSVCFSIDPISLILRKAKAAYEFSRSKEKINNLLFMDELSNIVAMRKD